MANSFRNAPGVIKARNAWYRDVNSGKKAINQGTEKDGTHFGFEGLKSAGLDIAEQFVGSYFIQIKSDGQNLTFILSNQNSFRSLLLDIGPMWERSTFPMMGNKWQFYIFTEKINESKIKNTKNKAKTKNKTKGLKKGKYRAFAPGQRKLVRKYYKVARKNQVKK